MPVSAALLSALQLTRLALVFTAISNSLAALILSAELKRHAGAAWYAAIHPWQLVATALMSAGFYGFGMSFNDIIDRRRDSTLAAHRPLPSGRLSLVSAYVICVACALVGMGAAVALGGASLDTRLAPVSLAIFVVLLIVFYDLAGKYLVAPGLITLGLIRFFHAIVPAPELPLLWHPLLLFNHVAILSAVCYALEDKRPRLSRGHWALVISGVALIDALLIAGLLWRRLPRTENDALHVLWIEPALILPAVAVLAFIGIAVAIIRTTPDGRAAGQQLMLAGLLWLIVYDAAFVGGYVHWSAALVLIALLPTAWLAVRFMRWWGKILSLSQTPQYQRAR